MADFHFIRPLWLTAIVALIIAIYLLKKYRVSQSGWHQLLPSHLSKILIDGKQQGQSLSLTLPFIIGLLAILALAGPTWKKLPQPVYQVAQGSVMIMDMSYSMYATDLTPNRLTRARYKAIDLLNSIQEGDIGLIAYAGDAFVISPLTEDVNNIKLLLPSLTPDLMPELGSNPLSALTLAHQMLKNSGHVDGNIYWFTDGIDNEDIQDINEWSREHPYKLNVMGVGTTAGAPIKLTNGELMKDDNGAIIIPKLPQAALNGVAKRASGNYVKLSNSDDDIERLTYQAIDIKTDKKTESDNSGDQWQEFGPYLLLLVLPLVLSYFRRGALLAIVPVMLLMTPSKTVYAADLVDDGQSLWQNLWQTKDQQGQKSFNNENFQSAAEQFEDPLWQGSAHYQAGNYEEALSAFQQSDSAEALYNQGNALAKLQQLDQAIAAYDKAIAKSPDHRDAKDNKTLLEQMKQEQEKQEQEQEKQQNQDNKDDQQQDKDQQQNSEQDQNKDSEQQQSEQNEKQDSEQQQDKQKDSEENSEDNKQENADQDKESKEKEKEKEQDAQQKKEEQKENEQKQAQQGQVTEDKLDKETEQKHQQLLNKVTDDPYLLLRNKMQLEYQKRRHNRSSVGVKKKW